VSISKHTEKYVDVLRSQKLRTIFACLII